MLYDGQCICYSTQLLHTVCYTGQCICYSTHLLQTVCYTGQLLIFTYRTTDTRQHHNHTHLLLNNAMTQQNDAWRAFPNYL
jgi:hypothetical protein